MHAQTQEFIRQHGDDTDEQLREFVRRKAMFLHRIPHPLEFPGGVFLSRRLGDWKRLAGEFGITPAGRDRGRKVYKRLREQEAELFAQERKARKAERQRLRQQATAAEEQA